MHDVLVATDGLPYLIELVAAVAPKRKLRQLADELKTRLREVRARGAQAELAGRHASVQACLEWALARLPSEEREALPRLAIFTSGFNAEAAKEVAATTIESLDVLVDASLLRFDRESGRYSMLPTTQQFLRGRIDDGEWARLASQHARWFVERLDRADKAMQSKGGENQMAARWWINAEYENVRQAVGWAEESDPELLGRAVESFALYLRETCRFSEDVRLQEARIVGIDPDADPGAWARTQNNLGNAYVYLRTGNRVENLDKAIACFEAALRVWTERDFATDWAVTQNNLGGAYWARTSDRAANLKKAITCYQNALRVWTESDFAERWAVVQNNLGLAYWRLPTGDRGENLAKAIACYEAALRVRTEPDFPANRATTQNNLGLAYKDLPVGDRRENLAKAIACFQAALEVKNERNFPKDWADTQYNLGLAYQALSDGEPDDYRQQAIVCFEAATRGYTAVGIEDEAEEARQRAAKLVATVRP